MTQQYPRFISVVAFALGGIDLLRGVAHTLISSYAASKVAGLDLSGPTGHDQLVLMTAFGAANFLSGTALIYLSVKDHVGALLFLTVIPVAYLTAFVGLRLNGTGLIGQGVFPGQYLMAGYISICLITVFAAFAAIRRRNQRALSF